MSVNSITIVGNLGDEPKLSYTKNNNTAVCNFSMAVNQQVYKDGGYVKDTLWFKVTAWGKQAESCAKYLQKGSMAYVRGQLGIDTWENRNNETQYTLTINADNVTFISGFKSTEEAGGTTEATPAASVPGDDGIPF